MYFITSDISLLFIHCFLLLVRGYGHDDSFVGKYSLFLELLVFIGFACIADKNLPRAVL